MKQSLERIILIGLNLTLLVSVGIPLLFSTTQIITETEQQVAIQDFIAELDEIIIFIEQNRLNTSRSIHVPSNVTIIAQGNQLVFKFFLNTWHIVTRSYSVNITITGPTTSGPHFVHGIFVNSNIHIWFELL